MEHSLKISTYLNEGLEHSGFNLSEDKISQLVEYFGMVLSTTKYLNLISSKQELSVQVAVHLLDSIIPLKFINIPEKSQILDFGSGGGFPGIPWSLILDKATFTLVESTGKKARFLESVQEALNLKNVKVINAFLEPGKNHERRTYDYITARAVSDLEKLADIIGPRLKPNGLFIAFKGPRAGEEHKSAGKALVRNKLTLINQFNFTLPIVDLPRCLLVLAKDGNVSRETS